METETRTKQPVIRVDREIQIGGWRYKVTDRTSWSITLRPVRDEDQPKAPILFVEGEIPDLDKISNYQPPVGADDNKTQQFQTLLRLLRLAEADGHIETWHIEPFEDRIETTIITKRAQSENSQTNTIPER